MFMRNGRTGVKIFRTVNPSWWRNLSWLPGLMLLVGLVIFVVRHFTEGEEFLKLLFQVRPLWLLLGVAFQAGTYFCAAMSWKKVLDKTGTFLSIPSLMRLAFQKVFIDQFLPSAGIGSTVVIVRSLRSLKVPARGRAATMVIYFFGYYLAYALAVAISLVLLTLHQKLNKVVLGLTLTFSFIALGVPAVILLLNRIGGWRPPHWIRRIPWLRKTFRAVSKVPPHFFRDPWLLLQVIGFQLFIFVLDAGTLGMMLGALGQVTAPATVFVSFMMASMAGTVSPIPGGLGTFEAGSLGMLTLLGISVKVSLMATLMLRGFTLWLPLLPGLWLSRRALFFKAKS